MQASCVCFVSEFGLHPTNIREQKALALALMTLLQHKNDLILWQTCNGPKTTKGETFTEIYTLTTLL